MTRFYGHPWHEYACPEWVESFLTFLRDELDRVMENRHQEVYESPFGNTGNTFVCDTFEVHAYDWGDDEQPFNFRWGDVEIRWYKYLGRGMSMNQELTPERGIEMLDACLAALRRMDQDGV